MTKTKEMGINHRTMKQKLAEYRHQPLSLLLLALTLLAAVITVGVLLCLIAYILYKGIPNMHLSLFAWKYTTENSSMMPAIINTLLMTVVTLMIAVPIGVFSAIYLVEYAKRGNKLVKVIRMTTETLQGIPSIVFGLFGFLMFVVACNFGFSLLGGAITLALMVLPLIMRTTCRTLSGRAASDLAQDVCGRSSASSCPAQCRESSPESFWQWDVLWAKLPH